MIFDCPTKSVDVNGKARTRVCVEGMVKLVRELDLPPGTVAHLEVGGGRSLYASQSCFVQGAASGQWLGVLVSHGLDVRLVAASTWKWALKLARRGQVRDKNASRELAKRWFANESNQVADALKRVKDHGRAEALLIAAHGHWVRGGMILWPRSCRPTSPRRSSTRARSTHRHRLERACFRNKP